MSAYYNEFDPFAAQWLRNLIAAGYIAPGEVDERSIVNVQPDDLVGFSQCHFFAGIGGWSLALRLAGWSDDRPVWTGSCPCQPFSTAGKGLGEKDERHLWPEFRRLISECSPSIVFGEQVAARAGREWLAAVRADLEALGYAVGAADLCAAGVGAPHIRQRLWFVAHANLDEQQLWGGAGCEGAEGNEPRPKSGRRGASGIVAHTASGGQQGQGWGGSTQGQRTSECGVQVDTQSTRQNNIDWSIVDWLFCRDELWRPTEPGTFPLAHGVPARVGRLRGYGNAIVPQVAQAFIEAVMECAP